MVKGEETRKLVVELFRASDRMRRRFAGVLEPHGLTLQQYNVLRILRGSGDEGLPTLSVGERMIEKTPGITRLLDRLEAKGLVVRERHADDRRLVRCRAAAKALKLLERLDPIVDRADEAGFDRLKSHERRALRVLLEKVW